MTAWKSVNPVFELWHRLVKVVDSASADDMCDVFLKKGIIFTKASYEKSGVERQSRWYKALCCSIELLCLLDIYNLETIKLYIRRVLRTRDLGKWI